MASADKAFLVLRRSDGWGDVFPLQAGRRYILGRAKGNEIVLKDDLCSRQHAEVFHDDDQWRIRDRQSTNGTRVNAVVVQEEALAPGDEIGLGQSQLVFVAELSQLPPAPAPPAEAEGQVAIKERMGRTRYDLLGTPPPAAEPTVAPADRHRLSRDLSLLYRLALDMGAATTFDELVEVVLQGLLEATRADMGALLTVHAEGRLEVRAVRARHAHERYSQVSDFVSQEVLRTREAVLAEDITRHRQLSMRDSLEAIGASSLICAPVLVEDQVKALIHLYSTQVTAALDREDLEFTVAVAKQLAVALQAVQRQIELHEENQRLKAQVATEVQLVGTSPPLQEIEAQIARVAPTSAIVLIRGESGVGKELVARAIHLSSPRRQGPFVCLNCAALAESLLESELFGHEKGAFTGATERKIGKFEAAHQGTLFLDEIGEMNPGAQAKLLRILEGHPYERVGGVEPIRVNVRVVAATNRSLEQAVTAGQFRRDLYFRLQVVEMRVPPLRERPTDIPLLAEHFLRRFLQETGRRIRGFTPAALDKMQNYSWPGNVRELRNVIERAVALSTSSMLDAQDIWLSNLEGSTPQLLAAPAAYLPRTLEEIEKLHIAATLRHTEWNKSQAAQILGIERSTLDRKIKAYELRR
jgi:Nif-specific regulatory protein